MSAIFKKNINATRIVVHLDFIFLLFEYVLWSKTNESTRSFNDK